LTVTVNLQSGQTIAGWTLDGNYISAGNSPFTETSREFRAADLSEGIHHVSVAVSSGGKPCSKEVTFRVTGTVYYTVQSASGIQIGTLSFSPTSAPEGANVAVTPHPSSGYRLMAGTLRYSGGGVTDQVIPSPSYTFVMPAGNVTVTAQFEKISDLNITFTGFGNETINLTADKNDLSRAYNDTLTVTVTPQSGQTIVGWTLDGVSIMNGASSFTGTSRPFRAVDLSVGNHYVAVALTKDGAPYSKEIHFTVEE
jgi:spore coat protein U-like protein